MATEICSSYSYSLLKNELCLRGRHSLDGIVHVASLLHLDSNAPTFWYSGSHWYDTFLSIVDSV